MKDESKTASFNRKLFEALYGNPDIEDGINKAMADIGKTFDVSRVYVFENSDDNNYGDNTYEWCDEGIEPQIQYLQHMSYEEYGYYDLFDKDGLFFCPDVTKLGDQQRELFESQGIKATLQYAMYDKGVFRGFVGYDDCNKARSDWMDDGVGHDTLVFLSKLLSVYLLKERNLQIAENYHYKLKNALDQAEKASRAKSEFMSNMSHDIRTPLNAIINLTNLAREELHSPSLLLADLDKIGVASEFLHGLINDILDMSRIESGRMELTPEVYPLEEFLSYIDSVISPLSTQKDIEFHVDRCKTNFDVFVDRVRFNQIFFNLLSNATKYTPAGGKVSLSILGDEVRDNKLCSKFVITDTGIGMSEDFQKKLFIPFERENSSAAFTGTGLGLSITKNIIDKMGGLITVQSTKNVGTRVEVSLDLLIATDNQSKEYREKHNKHQQSEKTECIDALVGKRILVVEDHPLNREIVVRILKKQNVVTECAENGRIAVEMFESNGIGYYDAVLMDIRMPEMDGLEASRRIRSLDRPDSKSVPIIAMTANAFESDITVSLEAGMNCHLSKPIDKDKLYSTLVKLI